MECHLCHWRQRLMLVSRLLAQFLSCTMGGDVAFGRNVKSSHNLSAGCQPLPSCNLCGHRAVITGQVLYFTRMYFHIA